MRYLDRAKTERGHVATYRPSRGFGFITPDHNCGDLFVRAEDVEDDNVELVPGQAVEYHPHVGEAGQLTAVAVRRLTGDSSTEPL